MPLKTLNFFDKSDVRLVILQNTVYKIKITCKQKSDSKNLRMICKGRRCQQELKDVICDVLCTDVLDIIHTDHFIVNPFKKPWETSDRIQFRSRGTPLTISRFVYVFYVERRRSQILQQPTRAFQRTTERRSMRCIHRDAITDDPKSGQDRLAAHSPDGPLGIITGQRKRFVEEYDPKNRHDVESEQLYEQLRLQELARPSNACDVYGVGTSAEADGTGNTQRGIFSYIRKWLSGN